MKAGLTCQILSGDVAAEVLGAVDVQASSELLHTLAAACDAMPGEQRVRVAKKLSRTAFAVGYAHKDTAAGVALQQWAALLLAPLCSDSALAATMLTRVSAVSKVVSSSMRMAYACFHVIFDSRHSFTRNSYRSNSPRLGTCRGLWTTWPPCLPHCPPRRSRRAAAVAMCWRCIQIVSPRYLRRIQLRRRTGCGRRLVC